MANNGIQVREGRTELTVPHLEGKLTFVAPHFGPNTYFALDEEVQKEGLERPTMAQTASLVDAAWQNPKEKYSAEIINILRQRWLWASNGFLYVSKAHEGKLIEGVYIQDRPIVKDNKIIMDESEVLNLTQSKDSSLRYVEPDFKTGELEYKEVAKHSLIIGLAGEEGADKLVRIARNYKIKPYIFVPNFRDSKVPITSVAALGEGYDGDRLNLNCDYYGSGRDGYVFGMCAEGAAQKFLEKKLYTLEQVSTALDQTGFTGAKKLVLKELQ